MAVVVLGLPALASAGEPSSGGALSGSLVVPGSPNEAQEREDEYESWLASPEARLQREASQTAFEHLSGVEARSLAGKDIAGVLDRPDGGPPSLPEGQRLGKFVSPFAAQVDLGSSSSYKALVQSSTPMASETAKGGYVALNMTPHVAGGAFRAKRGLVGAKLPEKLGEGARLPGAGITITPVDGKGAPLSGEGSVDGSSVFYANSEVSTDTVMKLSTFGVVSDVVLRSEASPEKLSYKLSLPAGATLKKAEGGSGVDVVRDGVAIMRMPAPVAREGAGHPVPVSVSVAGDVVTLTVVRKPGAVLYPVEVDPEFNELSEPESLGKGFGNWHSGPEEGGFTYTQPCCIADLRISHTGTYVANDDGYWYMHTNGDSKVYEVVAEMSPSTGGGPVSAWDALGEPTGAEVQSEASTSSGTFTACAGCGPSSGAEGNASIVQIGAQSSGEGSFSVTASKVSTYLAQPKETHASTFYFRSGTLDETNDVLAYQASWAQQWFGPNQGAFAFSAQDPGLGVSGTSVELKTATGEWEKLREKNLLSKEEGCIGVQCARVQSETITWGSLYIGYLKEGEDTIRVGAHDPMPNTSSLEHQTGEAKIKVDSEAPYNITLSGIPSKKTRRKKPNTSSAK